MATGGRLLVVGFAAGGIPTMNVNRLLLRNVSVVGVGWGEFVNRTPARRRRSVRRWPSSSMKGSDRLRPCAFRCPKERPRFADDWRAGYDEVDDLNRAWHRLDPWPDSVAGLTRLKQRFVITTLSNGNVSLLTNMAKRAGLPWDCVISGGCSATTNPTRGPTSAVRRCWTSPPMS